MAFGGIGLGLVVYYLRDYIVFLLSYIHNRLYVRIVGVVAELVVVDAIIALDVHLSRAFRFPLTWIQTQQEDCFRLSRRLPTRNIYIEL
jgi:hypothetical protein